MNKEQLESLSVERDFTLFVAADMMFFNTECIYCKNLEACTAVESGEKKQCIDHWLGIWIEESKRRRRIGCPDRDGGKSICMACLCRECVYSRGEELL